MRVSESPPFSRYTDLDGTNHTLTAHFGDPPNILILPLHSIHRSFWRVFWPTSLLIKKCGFAGKTEIKNKNWRDEATNPFSSFGLPRSRRQNRALLDK